MCFYHHQSFHVGLRPSNTVSLNKQLLLRILVTVTWKITDLAYEKQTRWCTRLVMNLCVSWQHLAFSSQQDKTILLLKNRCLPTGLLIDSESTTISLQPHENLLVRSYQMSSINPYTWEEQIRHHITWKFLLLIIHPWKLLSLKFLSYCFNSH